MGWARGGEIMGECIAAIGASGAGQDIRRRIYTRMILVFEDAGCDTLYECKGADPIFDSVYAALNPDEEE